MIWRNIVALLVGVLMLSQSAGFLFGIPMLSWVGKQSVFSPLPVPFRDNNGYENYVQRISAEVFFKNGSKREISDTRSVIESMPGTHRYKISYISSISWAPRLSAAVRYPVYQYQICESNVYGRDVAFVRFKYHNQRTDLVTTTSYECR